MLQKRVRYEFNKIEAITDILVQVMFYGHPLERLCTYQYSLVTLMPGKFLS